MGFVFSFTRSFLWQPLVQCCQIKAEILFLSFQAFVYPVQKALLFQEIVFYFKRFSNNHCNDTLKQPRVGPVFSSRSLKR